MDEILYLMRALRAGRVVVGLHQSVLAKRAGISKEMLSRIENINTEVSLANLEKVEAALRKLGVLFLPRTRELSKAVIINDFGLSGEMSALKAGRALTGLRQDEVADRAGVSRQIIIRIEQGDQSISVSRLQRVKAALEVAGVEFLPETDGRGPAVAMRLHSS